MARSYFILEKGIIEREDLSIYEKMCCVVLAKWASESIVSFNMSTLATQMSCSEGKAKATVQKLKDKGFIELEDKVSSNSKPPKIIKAENVDGLKPIDFNYSEHPKTSKEDLLTQVRALVDEAINDSEARIILNFANEDLEKIKRCYKKAKNMQISDKIEALIIELQRKEVVPPKLEERAKKEMSLEKEHKVKDKPKAEDKPSVEVKPWYLDDDEVEDDVIKGPSDNQINTNVLNKMKAYGKFGK